MPPKTISPADRVITAFGGVRETARAVARNPSSISRWRSSKEDGGTGGRVPGPIQGTVLAAAKQRGIQLTADDLMPG